MRRKVCYVVTNRAQYGRSLPIFKRIQTEPTLELQVVVAGSALSDKYGNLIESMERDGIPVAHKASFLFEGGNSVAMAKTTGHAILEIASALENLKPDIVVVRGDRYEMLGAAIAAAYMGILLAHIEGGDVSGTIDNSVRHAITKLADIHFVTNEESKQRVLGMGEDPSAVHLVGSPDVEFIEYNYEEIQRRPHHMFKPTYLVRGIGPELDLDKPYIVVQQHPDTNASEKGGAIMTQLLTELEKLPIQSVVFWPNSDAGSDIINQAMRQYINLHPHSKIKFFRNVPPKDFLALVNNAACLVGNSSVGIKECSYLGTPVVNIGDRQKGRLSGKNVISVGYDIQAITNAIKQQIAHGAYKREMLYSKPDTSTQIVTILKQVTINKEDK